MEEQNDLIAPIMIGISPDGKAATVSPSAKVLPSGSRVCWELVPGTSGTAKVILPEEGNTVVDVVTGPSARVPVTHTGSYYVVVGDPALRVGAIAVIIIDP